MFTHVATIVRRVTVLGTILFATACSTDAVTSPQLNVSPDAHLIAGLGKPIVSALLKSVTVGNFNTSFLAAQSQSVNIGPQGGTLTLASTGFELVVPPGAVDSMTTFSVTLHPGSAMAYEFEPHGAKFKKALRFRQNVSVGNLSNYTVFFGGYYANQSNVHGTWALVSELLPALSVGGWIEFSIWHFSGYLVSCA